MKLCDIAILRAIFKDGKKVKRKEWASDAYLCQGKEEQTMDIINVDMCGRDLEADDWEVIENATV